MTARSREQGAWSKMPEDPKLFRFEDLEVWQRASDLGYELGGLADQLEEQRRYRFAEQLRAAGLSISNNIAEGSGSTSNTEFRQFLNFARRSAFECANMLLMFRRQNLTSAETVRPLLLETNVVCRMITALSRSLD
jgi:four helix bundle protein